MFTREWVRQMVRRFLLWQEIRPVDWFLGPEDRDLVLAREHGLEVRVSFEGQLTFGGCHPRNRKIGGRP